MARWSPPSARTVTLVPYLLAFSISWTLAAAAVWAVGNGDLFLFLNGLGSRRIDPVFGFLTMLGDGWVFAIACCLLFAWHRRSGLAAFAAFGMSSGVSALLKHTLFKEYVRPNSFFGQHNVPIHLPDGVDIHNYNSFPSGHTTSIFCLACLLAYFFPRPRLQLGLLVLAWLVGLSRIMQAQHFPFDVLAGALLGTGSAVIMRDAFFKWDLPRKLGLPTRDRPAPPASSSNSAR